MFKIFIRSLVFYAVIAAAFTVPELAPVAQAITYVLWPLAVFGSLVFIGGKDEIARKNLAEAGPKYDSRYAPLFWPMRAATLFAIACSGRPALAVATFVFLLTAEDVISRIKELRAEQAQQDQPAPQVKCPGHR
jgi:hypothetical protein